MKTKGGLIGGGKSTVHCALCPTVIGNEYNAPPESGLCLLCTHFINYLKSVEVIKEK